MKLEMLLGTFIFWCCQIIVTVKLEIIVSEKMAGMEVTEVELNLPPLIRKKTGRPVDCVTFQTLNTTGFENVNTQPLQLFELLP